MADTRVAFVGALSGPAAAAGRDQRDGLLLAGLAFEEFDDRGDASRANSIAERLLAGKITFVTGLTTSEAARALQRRLKGKPVLLLSSGAGPAELAGKGCDRRFFSTGPPEDAVHANAGAIARLRRYKSLHLVASPVERAAVTDALRTQFSGELTTAVVQGGSAEAIREIRSKPPHAVYLALDPERMLGFLRAYEDAGLYHRIPVIAAAVEPSLLQKLGSDFSGLIVSVRWTAGLETEGSRKFIEAFERRYGRLPSSYAMQGYEAALALRQAFRAAGTDSVDAVAAALAGITIEGVAGPVRFGANGFAEADWHAWEVFNDATGAPYLVGRERTLQSYSGPNTGQVKSRRGSNASRLCSSARRIR